MKIKSGVWYWLAVASGAVGLLYGLVWRAVPRPAAPFRMADFITAMVLSCWRPSSAAGLCSQSA